MGELRSYTPPWHDRVVNYLTDTIYGPNATAQDRSQVNLFAGTPNPFNALAHASSGVGNALAGYRRGDPYQTVGGVAEAALAALPFAGAGVARSGLGNAMRDRMMAKSLQHYPGPEAIQSRRYSPPVDDFAMYQRPPSGRSVAMPARAANDDTGDAGKEAIASIFRPADGSSLTGSAAYEKYTAAMDDIGIEPMPIQSFGRMMQELGYQKATIAGRVRYIGIE